jgi:hypothetical protein
MDILKALRDEESKLQHQLDTIRTAIQVMSGNNSGGKTAHKKWSLSASARARIAKAQKARWAKIRAAKKNA